MKFTEYQEKAIAFANHDLEKHVEIAVWGMGLAGESGELIDLMKKTIGHNHPLDLDKVKKELGDCLWYVNAIACHFSMPLDSLIPRDGSKAKSITKALLRLDARVGEVSEWIEFYLEFGGDSNLDIALIKVLYPLKAIAHHFGFTLEEIAAANIEKLTARYGDRFSSECSINRKD